jgi:hypothetical protein
MAWILLFVLAALCAIATARGPPVVPSTGAVASGIYRNVFVEAGYAEADVTHRLAAIVNQLFAGNPENETLLYPAEDKSLDALYLFDVSDNDVRTEGMSVSCAKKKMKKKKKKRKKKQERRRKKQGRINRSKEEEEENEKE